MGQRDTGDQTHDGDCRREFSPRAFPEASARADDALICSTTMPRPSSQMLELAKRGAEARLQDLIHEAQMRIELFPHLRDSFDKDELPISFIVAKDSGQLVQKRADGRRRRRRMSAAARRAVSLR
jgi:hypothetical protein